MFNIVGIMFYILYVITFFCQFYVSVFLDHPGRVTLKTEELFLFLSSTIREGDPSVS